LHIIDKYFGDFSPTLLTINYSGPQTPVWEPCLESSSFHWPVQEATASKVWSAKLEFWRQQNSTKNSKSSYKSTYDTARILPYGPKPAMPSYSGIIHDQ